MIKRRTACYLTSSQSQRRNRTLRPLIISYGNNRAVIDHSAWMSFIQLGPYWRGPGRSFFFIAIILSRLWLGNIRPVQRCGFWLWCEELSSISLTCTLLTKSMQLATVGGHCRIYWLEWGARRSPGHHLQHLLRFGDTTQMVITFRCLEAVRAGGVFLFVCLIKPAFVFLPCGNVVPCCEMCCFLPQMAKKKKKAIPHAKITGQNGFPSPRFPLRAFNRTLTNVYGHCVNSTPHRGLCCADDAKLLQVSFIVKTARRHPAKENHKKLMNWTVHYVNTQWSVWIFLILIDM